VDEYINAKLLGLYIKRIKGIRNNSSLTFCNIRENAVELNAGYTYRLCKSPKIS